MKRLFLLLTLLFTFLLVGCGGDEDALVVEVTRVVTETVVEEGEAVEVTRVVTEQGGVDADTSASVPANPSSRLPARRLIIKNGQMDMTVANTEQSVEAATEIVTSVGGYIVSQQVWEENGYFYARIQVGVPVDTFEEVMQALAGLGTVSNQSASGEDVTEEYVDLESRLGNLQATQERLRGFLAEAENVEEVLAVNEELTKIEEELEVVQGRMQYLGQRAAFSTITLDIKPLLPTPTPSPTATATPLPTPQSWQPGNTARLAAVNLQDTVQEVADFSIYYGITCGPWLLVVVPFALVAWWLLRRSQTENVPSPTRSEATD